MRVACGGWYSVLRERCGAITRAVVGTCCMMDRVLVNVCQVMGSPWLDALVLYGVRRNIAVGGDNRTLAWDSLIMCSGLTCYG
jgi:hypothetical protein